MVLRDERGNRRYVNEAQVVMVTEYTNVKAGEMRYCVLMPDRQEFTTNDPQCARFVTPGPQMAMAPIQTAQEPAVDEPVREDEAAPPSRWARLKAAW